MKKLKFIVISVIFFGAIIGILLNNKAKSNGKSVNNISTMYSVNVTKAAKKILSEKVTLAGIITANNDVAIISETSGKIVKVESQIGDYKTAGSVLVQVDDEIQKANYLTAEVNYKKSKKDLERYEDLYKGKSISDTQIESVRLAAQSAEAQYILAKRQYQNTKITTPISGIVTARNVDIGSMVQSGPNATVIGNVVDISKLKVKLNVAERDVFKISVGEKVDITTDVYPEKIFTGKISTISSKGDEAHSYPVEIQLENNSKYPLKAGMFGSVTFLHKKDTPVLVIPRAAIIGSINNAKIYIVKDNIAKLQNVVIGEKRGLNVEIVQGLIEGEIVVVNGQNNLSDGAKVSPIMQ